MKWDNETLRYGDFIITKLYKIHSSSYYFYEVFGRVQTTQTSDLDTARRVVQHRLNGLIYSLNKEMQES